MEPSLIGISAVIMLLVMLLLGFHVVIAMGVSGLVGFWMITGNFEATASLAVSTAFSVCSTYDFFILPLFILLGAVVLTSGMATSIYEAVYRWITRIPGALAIGTAIAVAIFSAVSGSALACAVTFSKGSIPEMVKRGYNPGFATGLVAAAATQDALIPPSGLLVIYAIITDQSIARCLIAGFIPGILSIALYILLIVICVKVRPHWFGRSPSFSMKEKLASLKGAWQIPLLGILVLGAMYTGITTATEAAAVGTFLAIVIGLGLVGFKRLRLHEGLRTTVKASGMLFAILVGAYMFGSMLAISRIPNLLADFITMSGMSRWTVFLIIIMLFSILGMMMSSTAFIVTTMPIVFPVMMSLGFDPIWFGIITVKMCGIGMLTPPVGLSVYATKSAVGDLVKLEDAFRAAALFLIADYVCLALMCLFPDIVLFLPQRMMG